MLTIFSVLSAVATAVAGPMTHHVTEVPELASMALLSVVLAGVSMAVRRTGPKAGGAAARAARRGTSRP
jgi:ABC-type Mn2+/Zn2+ transport system permease subunit